MTTKNEVLGCMSDNLYGSDENQVKIGDLTVIIFHCSTLIVCHVKIEVCDCIASTYLILYPIRRARKFSPLNINSPIL
jgi:hypothetical protein